MLFLYLFVEEEFIWCYKDEKCDQFAWNKNVPVSYLYEFRHIQEYFVLDLSVRDPTVAN